MSKFFNEIWNLVKLFPMTSCGIFTIITAISVQVTDATYDSQGLSGGVSFDFDSIKLPLSTNKRFCRIFKNELVVGFL